MDKSKSGIYPILGMYCHEADSYRFGMKWVLHLVIMLLAVPALLLSGSAEAGPNLSSISPAMVAAGSVIRLSGSDFGIESDTSEVIADYGYGFHYALEHSVWSDDTIKLKLPDLGKHLLVKLHVKVGNEASNNVSITLKPDIRKHQHGDFKREHVLTVGDKGEDVFKVINQPAACGKESGLFDHAEISYDKKRFAEAQFVSLPAKGCARCRDIRVRWYNEPTGSLKYRLTIFQRRIEGICAQRVRQ